MAKKTKIKAKLKKGVITVKVLATHSMMSYDEAKKKKKPANFITYITGTVNNEIVFEASTSQFLSKNPYLKFKFKGANKGDKIEIKWTDLSGKSNVSKSKIK